MSTSKGIEMTKAGGATDTPDETDNSEQEQDDFLEEALEETFPASDPIAPGRPTRERSKDRSSI
jgi:hypothetical protein